MSKGNDELQEQFERYLLRQLPPEEVQAFEQQLDGDEMVKAAFEQFRIAFMAVQQEGLRRELDQIMQASPVRFWRRPWVRAAAILIGIVLLSPLLFLKMETVYYVNTENFPAPLLPSESLSPALFSLFEQEEYELALATLDSLDIPADEKVFFLGQANYGLSHYQEADAYWASVAQSSEYYDDALYYRMRSLFMLGKFAEAQALRDVFPTESPYYEVVVALFDNMDEELTIDSTRRFYFKFSISL